MTIQTGCASKKAVGWLYQGSQQADAGQALACLAHPFARTHIPASLCTPQPDASVEFTTFCCTHQRQHTQTRNPSLGQLQDCSQLNAKGRAFNTPQPTCGDDRTCQQKTLLSASLLSSNKHTSINSKLPPASVCAHQKTVSFL